MTLLVLVLTSAVGQTGVVVIVTVMVPMLVLVGQQRWWSVVIVAVLLVTPNVDGRRRTRHNQETEDFEFADEAEAELQVQRKQVYWDQDDSIEMSSEPPKDTETKELLQNRDLCAMVRCPMGSACQVSQEAAVCVRPTPPTDPTWTSQVAVQSETTTEEPEVELTRSQDMDSKSLTSACTACPALQPNFVCGSDNRTYSSPCRLQYHNCVQKSAVTNACRGFCPCVGKPAAQSAHSTKQSQVKHRWHKFVNKYESTVAKATGSSRASNKLSVSGADKVSKSRSTAAPPINEDKQRHKGYNSVLVEKVVDDVNKKDCSAKQLQVMGDRILDWFSVVMMDAKRNKSRRRSYLPSPATFSTYCKPEVQWMFSHLDRNSDAQLSYKELYELEYEAREHCVKPFLERCDLNKDTLIAPHEWCKCFDQSDRPCAASRHRIRKAHRTAIGGYYPDCDERGFFRRLQCHHSTGLCWCVNRHGVEYVNTRLKGRPDCDSLIGKAESKVASDEDVHEDDSDDDDDDDEGDDDDDGSADRPLDI